MKKDMYQIGGALSAMLMLAGCSTFESRPQTVWEMYDVRKLQGGAVPQQPVGGYYGDNDAYYSPPVNSDFGLCSSDDLAGFSCN